MADTAMDILMRDFLPEATITAIEAEVEKIPELPVVKSLAELRRPVYGNDPSELIKHRFLYRGGVLLLLGPTGIGKSALNMQIGLHLTLGKSLFGIDPGDCYQGVGMRVLLIQAENDEGDLSEMCDGVLAGCETLTEEEKRSARVRMQVTTVSDKSGENFGVQLEGLIKKHEPDLVILDPAFAYLGGDSNSQRDVSRFMREMLNPLLQTYDAGMMLVHHTNKPLRGKEKDSWAAGDFAYLGAGSAEWINPARAALALRSIGSDRVFEFRAAKRGRRLRWLDPDGQPTNVKYLAHHNDPKVICWVDAEPGDVDEILSEDKRGRPRKCDAYDVMHCVRVNPNQNQTAYKQMIGAKVGCSENAAQRAMQRAIDQGLIRFVETGKQKVYRVSPKGEKQAEKRPSEHDWKTH